MIVKVYNKETSQQFVECPDAVVIDTNKNIIVGYNDGEVLFSSTLSNIRVDIEN